MEKQNKPLTAEERWPELDKIAQDIAENTIWQVNRWSDVPTKENLPHSSYKKQCVLEMVIKKLEAKV